MSDTRTESQPSGILIIDKPTDWTSFDVVAKVRRVFKIKKVGHAGTLDPMATGLLIVLVGSATKWSERLLIQDKKYIANVQFGRSTDTGDAEGKIELDRPISKLTQKNIVGTLPLLMGTREQMVPAYSAVKVGGKKLYEMARKGSPMIDRPVRQVTISKLELLQFHSHAKYPSADIEVECSKGTYIRVLAEEIAAKLGTVAHLTALQRTASGSFTLDQSVTLEKLLHTNTPELYLKDLPE